MRDDHNVWSELLSHRVRELCEMRDELNVWNELLSHRVRELCE